LLTFSGSSLAQWISPGVKGGVAITAPGASNNEGKRYEVGPSVEFRLPARFAVEFSALYSRAGASTLFYYAPMQGGQQTTAYRTRGNHWQFPLLGKYYFRSEHQSWRPYLGTGYTFRTTWYEIKGQTTSVDPISNTTTTSDFQSHFRSAVDVGAMAAGGVRLQVGRVKVLPEIRYSRFSEANSFYRKNQVTFLMGITF